MIQSLKTIVASYILVFLGITSFSQKINHWETIVQTGDYYTYTIPSAEIGNEWKTLEFKDKSWINAISGVGYGDGDDNTEILKGTKSVYIRYNFIIKDVNQIASLVPDAGHYDGFIAYLNGKELARDNVTDPALWKPEPQGLHKAALFSDFNLPLMVIDTKGQTIPDEPRIVADMGLIYNGEGNTNSEYDQWNEYSGKISIERRGESSKGFKKKSYSIELQKEDGSNNNVSILGLPIENDFVLYGPYSDKTLMKNVLSYELFRRTGRWAPRTRYIEIILNGDYRGIYVLTEKLKRDENRVDIDKLTKEDTTDEEISGGYILRRDKKQKLTLNDYWTSPVTQPYHETMWYEYYDPEYDELTDRQSNYIKDWMEEFDEVMSGGDFNNGEFGYKKYIRTNSFIDMMFLNEISKGIDNYMFSTYFFKENDEDGGELNAGPPWDYNVGYGNVNYGEDWNAAEPEGWCYPQGSRTYWFERLMEDDEYRNRVYCRWTEFRESIYSDNEIEGIIDSCVTVLGDAVERNFLKYPILGEYIWPAIHWPDTYQEEVEALKDWLFDRLNWMDYEWYGMGNCLTNSSSNELANQINVRFFPNPSDFSNLKCKVELKEPVRNLRIEIYDTQGRIIQQQEYLKLNTGQNILQIPNLAHVNTGMYFYRIYNSFVNIKNGKISKY